MKIELLKSKQVFESCIPPFLSYELWKLEIQTPPEYLKILETETAISHENYMQH